MILTNQCDKMVFFSLRSRTACTLAMSTRQAGGSEYRLSSAITSVSIGLLRSQTNEADIEQKEESEVEPTSSEQGLFFLVSGSTRDISSASAFE